MENINYVQHIILPKQNSYIVPAIMLVFFILLFIACIGLIYYMKNTTININNEYLTIKTLFYGKKIPLDEINANGIKKLDLNKDTEYNIKIRTNGIGLPNYHLGWMRLNNGNKALVYLTDKSNVILIPTDEYDILISVDNFDMIKEILNKAKIKV
jgi:hypothetical protein